MPLTHYTVGYHDTELHHYEICEYATDAYEAIKNSKEDVSYLREHPFFIDYCVTESWRKTNMKLCGGWVDSPSWELL